ncbi:hypothetical protein C8R45DRAFT_966709 [Mycena sanguinolenta]|nr:hypothetical protein C8R45DRAFT_966709 [Mycena sanguinolenta]
MRLAPQGLLLRGMRRALPQPFFLSVLFLLIFACMARSYFFKFLVAGWQHIAFAPVDCFRIKNSVATWSAGRFPILRLSQSNIDAILDIALFCSSVQLYFVCGCSIVV